MTSADHQKCSSEEIEALCCELLDNCTSETRAAEIRAIISECQCCSSRLDSEELVRQMVKGCDKSTHAPETLREKISYQIHISQTEVRWQG
ncbi:anti-sigma factor [Corynebacterium sp. L4756]|uniref:anti-sigma factor n=1 Tax=unclassified Corynebacterium TaxID=2624378 RepID=UPI00374D9171